MKLTEYDISHPYMATIVMSERITDGKSDEVRHIVLSIADTTFHHIESQTDRGIDGGDLNRAVDLEWRK